MALEPKPSLNMPIDQAPALREALPNIDGFEVLELLGSGGMSSVYKARQTTMDKLVALKVLHERPDSTQFARFKQESTLAVRLRHPNIGTVTGFGVTKESCPYLVMEFLDGQTLSAFFRQYAPLNEQQIKEIFSQICAGLQFAHEAGVIHRDLKPANIFLQEIDGRQVVRILDFGIAKILENSPGAAQKLTQTGAILGSPVYMSPEQCTGAAVDVRSDIYSLGCLLYEAACAQPPFSGETAFELATKHIGEQPPAVTKAGGKKCPAFIQHICQRALEKSPEKRYSSVAELQADLQGMASPKIAFSLRRRTAWKLTRSGLAAAVFLVLSAVAVSAYAIWQRVDRNQVPPNTELQAAGTLLHKGDFAAAYDRLLALRNSCLSDGDATELCWDLCDLAIVLDQDRRSGAQYGPKPLRDSVAAFTIQRACEPNGNKPRPFAVCYAKLLHAQMTGQSSVMQHEVNTIDFAKLDPDDRRYCTAIRAQVIGDKEREWSGDTNEALKQYKSAVDLLSGSAHGGKLISIWLDIAAAYDEAGLHKQAESARREAVNLIPAACNSADRETAFALSQVADIACRQNRLDLAQIALAAAGRMFATKSGGKHPAMGEFYLAQANLHRRRSLLKEAYEYYCQAERQFARLPGDHPAFVRQFDAQSGQSLCRT